MRGSRDLARSLTTLKARYLAVNFIGLAMIAAVFVYAGVVELLKWQLAPFAGFAKLDPGTAALIKYIFLALAAAQFGVIKTVQNAEFRGPFERQMTEAVTNTPEEFRKFVEGEIKAMGPVVKTPGLQPF